MSAVHYPLSANCCPVSDVRRSLSTVQCLLFAARCPLSAARCSLFFFRCRSESVQRSVVRCPCPHLLSAIYYPLSAVRRLLSTIHCLLSAIHRPLSAVHCLLSTVHCPVSSVRFPLSCVHCPLPTLHCRLSCPVQSSAPLRSGSPASARYGRSCSRATTRARHATSGNLFQSQGCPVQCLAKARMFDDIDLSSKRSSSLSRKLLFSEQALKCYAHSTKL